MSPLPARLAGGEVIVTDRARPTYAAADTISAYVADDTHRFTFEDLEALRTVLSTHDMIAAPYLYARHPADLPHFAPEERSNWVAFPHGVPDPVPLPRNADAAPRGFAVTPGHPKPYPTLSALRTLDLPSMTWLAHPGHGGRQADAMRAARDAWWSTLAVHHIGIVGLGWGPGGYALAKYVEYLYAGLLLLAERPNARDCELLGLRHMENCILFDWPTERAFFLDTYQAACRNFNAFASIANAGQRLARRRHSARSRLAYLRRTVSRYRDTGRVPSRDEQFALLAASEHTTVDAEEDKQ